MTNVAHTLKPLGFGNEFLVGFEIEVTLQLVERNDVAELWPDAGDARLETPEPVTGTAVAIDLIKNVTH